MKQSNEQTPAGYMAQRADLYDMLICIGAVITSAIGLIYLADRYNLIAPILAQVFGF